MNKAQNESCSCLLIVAIAVATILLGIAGTVRVLEGHGQTEVEVEFLVTDADTEQPIPGATVEVRGPGVEEGEQSQGGEVRLVTDEAGVARRRCRCTWYGERGWLRSTFTLLLPGWQFRASAPGYDPSQEMHFTEDQGHRSRRQNGSRAFAVPIHLHKPAPPAPEAGERGR
jgi:hypothetical protein